MKYLVDERVEKGYPDEPLLTASQSRGVIPKADYGSRTVEAVKDLHLLKLVEPGDYVISLRSFQGGIEFAHVRGIISPAYTVLEPKRDVRRGYYEHFFKSADFINSMTLFVTGIREGQNIDYVRLSRAYMPVPPPEEQDAIGRFIRHLDHRVNQLIKTKRRLIELLNEQKQAIIHRAVTRGLDPTVPLKPSGIDWLGDIPEHWKVMSLRQACSLLLDGTHFSPKTDIVGDYLYISAKNIKEDGILTSNATFVSTEAHELIYKRCPVKRGDVLYIKDGATAGLATVNQLEEPFSMLSSVALLRPKPGAVMNLFLALALNDVGFKQDALMKVVGGAMTRFTIALIKSFRVALPPIEEQIGIAKFVDSEVAPLAAAIEKAQAEIDLIREYRTRLVADVVTGQLDVRHLDLPEVEESLIEAMDAGSEDDTGEGDVEEDVIA